MNFPALDKKAIEESLAHRKVDLADGLTTIRDIERQLKVMREKVLRIEGAKIQLENLLEQFFKPEDQQK